MTPGSESFDNSAQFICANAGNPHSASSKIRMETV